jgi:hypothetical protein
MPVTAKLSRLFYERLGEQVANELVDWLNSVDLTYRSDLRDINELNYARFSAEAGARIAEQTAWIKSRFAEQTAWIETRFAEMDARIDRRFAEMDAKFEKRFAEMDAKFERRFAEFEVRIERAFRDQTRFLYVALVAQMALIAGLYLK